MTLTISSKGQVAIPKKVRDTLRIKSGDQFTIAVEKGKIVLKPVVTVTVPREQAWFWTPEIQKTIKEAEENYREGKFKRYENADKLIKDLEDRK